MDAGLVAAIDAKRSGERWEMTIKGEVAGGTEIGIGCYLPAIASIM